MWGGMALVFTILVAMAIIEVNNERKKSRQNNRPKR
jgi:hypothetical protein